MRRKLVQKKIVPILLVLVVLSGIFAIPTVLLADHCSSVPVGQCNADPQCVVGAGVCQNAEGHGVPVCGPDSKPDPETGTCVPLTTEDLGNPLTGVRNFVGGAFNAIATGIGGLLGIVLMTIAALLLGIAGLAFDMVIQITILNMDEVLQTVTAINISWTLVRDVANVIFIFLLLYIAIAIILNVSSKAINPRSLLVRVIVAAILINFSLFFTRVIIDASNIIAIGFHQPLEQASEFSLPVQVRGEGSGDTTFNFDIPLIGISGAFMQEAGIQTFFDTKGSILGAGSNDVARIVQLIMGAVFMLITAFIFFFAAILLLIRFVMFILLMVTSPVAFIATLLPKTKQLADMWWKHLINNALFAPAFMLLLTLSYLVVSGMEFAALDTEDVLDSPGLAALFSGSVAAIPVILNFFIAMTFLIAAILISKNLASQGGEWAGKTAGRLTFGVTGKVGRQTLGRAGRGIAESNFAKGLADSKSIYGRMIGRTLVQSGERAQKASYDLRGTKFGSDTLGAGKAPKGGFKKEAAEAEKREREYAEKGAEARANEEAIERPEITQKRKTLDKEMRDVRTQIEKVEQTKGFRRQELESQRLQLEEEHAGLKKERDELENLPRDQKETTVGEAKRRAEKDLADTSRNLSSDDIENVRKKHELEKEIAEEKDEKQVAKLQEKLDELTQNIGKMSDPMKEYAQALERHDNVEGFQKGAQTMEKRKSAQEMRGSKMPSRREAGVKILKELSKSKEAKQTDQIIGALKGELKKEQGENK